MYSIAENGVLVAGEFVMSLDEMERYLTAEPP
jgi:hypothetical protein